MRSSKEIEKEYWDKFKKIGKFDHPELSKLRKELKCAESNAHN